jgi:hypothetical protein
VTAPTTEPRLTRFIAIAVAAAAIIPFLPALGAGFCQYDDPGVLMQDPGYRGLAPQNIAWMFTSTRMGHYQPLTWVTYGLDSLIWGMRPVGYHLTNLLLHALNAALVFLVSRRLIAAAWQTEPTLRLEIGAAIAALLFAVHPLRVESVAWITERRDVLSTAFLLLSLLAYLRAFPPLSVGPMSLPLYALSVGLLVLSLLSKAWGMSFFVILMVLDWYPLRRLPLAPWRWFGAPARLVLVQKLPFVALGLGAAVTAAYAVHSVPFAVMPLARWGVEARLFQACYGLMFYLEKSVWPFGLTMLYSIPRHFGPLEPRFVAGVVFVAAGLIALWMARRRFPSVIAAAVVYAVVLGPVLGFLQSGPQLVADRYSYIATMPWAIVLGGAAASLASRAGGIRRVPAIAAAVCLALGAVALRQTSFWRTDLALFRHTIDQGQGGAIILELYGKELAGHDRQEEALAQYIAATEIDPEYSEAWFSRATTLEALHREAEAESVYRHAAGIMADSWRPNLMIGMMFLRRADALQGDAQTAALKMAENCFRASVANVESPYPKYFSSRPYLMLAAALDLQGRDQEAREWLVKASRYDETKKEAVKVLQSMDAEGR